MLCSYGFKSNELYAFVCSQIYAKLNFHIYSLVTDFHLLHKPRKKGNLGKGKQIISDGYT